MMISKKSKIDVDANNGYLFLSYLIFLRIAIFLATTSNRILID